MIINKIFIKKFRGFKKIEFSLGKQLTAIAGQNGTQKTTLLGILSQPFSITDKTNPMIKEKPMCGGSFKSAFAEKFKLSEKHDKPKNHEWTINLSRIDEPDFTLESIERSNSSTVRFWKKGDRSKGSGYIQLPVIYLSLSRLFPIGEDNAIISSNDYILSKSEFEFYQKWHNKILIIPDVMMINASYLASKQKNTLGANTSFYDWKMNSAGQDNIGKILLAILSFKRLKEKYPNNYKGGILAIDELDATLYPASQLKLIEALRKYSSQYNLQIIFTTHSLNCLEKVCELQDATETKDQTKVVYLEKVDSEIRAIENLSFDLIKHKLNVTMDSTKKILKIPVFVEDKEGEIFFKALIKGKANLFKFYDSTLGCGNLLELSRKKIPCFKFPNSLIILDGDVKLEKRKMTEIDKLENLLLLPGTDSPERLIANFLNGLYDDSPIWNNIHQGYNKQFVFKDQSLKEIQDDRKKAKKWFNAQKKYWGRNCTKVINPWINNNKEEVDDFNVSFIKKYNKFANQLSLEFLCK